MTYLHHLKKLDPNIQEEKAVYVTLRSEISQFLKESDFLTRKAD